MKTWMKWMAVCCLPLLAACGGKKMNPDRVKQACVRIVTDQGMGTGFLVNDKGDIVTNHHVTAGANVIFVLSNVDGKIHLHQGKLIAKTINEDMAVVSSSVRADPLVINRVQPKVGDEVSSCGFPGISDDRGAYEPLFDLIVKKKDDPKLAKVGGLDVTDEMNGNRVLAQLVNPSVSPGKVTRISEQFLGRFGEQKIVKDGKGNTVAIPSQSDKEVNVIEHSVAIGHGNSGGPLLDAAGMVIGVVGQGRAARDSDDKVTFATSATMELEPFLSNDAKVPYATTRLDASNLGRLSTLQMILLSLFGAAVLVAVGVGIFYLAKRPATAGPSMTTIIDEMKRRGMAGEEIPVRPVPVTPPLPPAQPPVEVAWEVEMTGPNGMRMIPRLTGGDFARAGGKIVLGRNSDFSSLTVSHESVSRQHLHFVLIDGGLAVADRNSSNGTRVNGKPLSTPFKEQSLREGDVVEFGKISAVVRRAV